MSSDYLPEGSSRETGMGAQKTNIKIARLIGEIVKTTLGPKGMDKMLVDSLGDVTVTNDGATILRELQAPHPCAKTIIEVARMQDAAVGDGTTTVVVLAGELLKQAEGLLDKRIHPTLIVKGYQDALRHALLHLDSMAESPTSEQVYQVAETAMTGKSAENDRQRLAKIVVNACQTIFEGRNKAEVRRDEIRLEAKTGGTVQESEIINGVVLMRGRAHPSMPLTLHDARVAIIEEALQTRHLDRDTKVSVNTPADIEQFFNSEAAAIKLHVDRITKAGAQAVFCNKGIDEAALHFLSKEGILAVERVAMADLELLSKATGARITTRTENLTAQDLGQADEITHRVFDKIEHLIITRTDGCAVTILARGATGHIAEEAKRALEDAIGDVFAVLQDEAVVYGAGHTEIVLSRAMHRYADTLKGRQQLVVKAFAEALEVIPCAIAENAGLDPIDALADLKSAINTGDKVTNQRPGLDVDGGVLDARKAGIIEPLRLKTQALKGATGVATMILRIDDLVQVNRNPNSAPDLVAQGQVKGR